MAPQTTDAAPSAMDRLSGALGDYVSAKIGNAVGKVGEKVASTTQRLDNFATGGGKATGNGTSASDNPGTEDDAKVQPGSTKVTTIVETLDVGVPLRTAYDHWTRYEEFGQFSKGVNSVSKEDELTSSWDTHIAFSSRSFEATVQEQVPDERIVWTSTGAKGSTQGVVTFHELTPTLTRIVLVVEYSPAGFFEKTGNLWHAQGRRIRLDFKNFQSYVTLSPEDPDGWRGEIRDGEVVRTDEEVRADDDQADEDSYDDSYDDSYAEDSDEGSDGDGEADDSR